MGGGLVFTFTFCFIIVIIIPRAIQYPMFSGRGMYDGATPPCTSVALDAVSDEFEVCVYE